MPAPDAAIAHYRRQQRLTALAVAAARRSWARLGSGNWDAVVPQLILLTMAAQKSAATAGAAYVPNVLDELNIESEAAGRVGVAALVGVASDGRPLASLMGLPVSRVRNLIAAGMPDRDALQSGGALLDRIVQTQVADAGRAAESVGMVSRPQVGGYVRMLNLPSCSRCAILAGKFYKWNAGFKRHDSCDCVHIPTSEDVAGDLRTDPDAAFRSGQVTGLSLTEARAIRDGSDINQVVNSRRGMRTAQVYGQRVKITTEGTTRRGLYSVNRRAQGPVTETVTSTGRRGAVANYKVRRVPPRLRPESIYEIAGDDRAEAIRLLKLNSYLI